jgi:hypothetical protein
MEQTYLQLSIQLVEPLLEVGTELSHDGILRCGSWGRGITDLDLAVGGLGFDQMERLDPRKLLELVLLFDAGVS